MDLVEIGFKIRAEGLDTVVKKIDGILVKTKALDKETKSTAKSQEASAKRVAASTNTKVSAMQREVQALKNVNGLMAEGFTRTQALKIANYEAAGVNKFQTGSLKSVLNSMNQNNAALARGTAAQKAASSATAKAASINKAFNNQLKKETLTLEYYKEGYARATAAKLASARVSGVSKAEVAKLGAAIKATNAYAAANIKLATSAVAASSGISSFFFSFKLAIAAAAGLALLKMADTMELLRSRARLVTPVTESVNTAMGRLVKTSMASRASLVDTVTLYNRLTPAMKRYGLGTEEVFKVITSFNSSLLISGATARETSSAILQFSQSMAAGKLAGDEFRSVTEAAPELLNAIAEGSGKARDALKDMSKNGLLTTKFVAEALIKQMENLKQRAGEIPVNIQQGITNLKTSFSYLISVINNSTGATGSLAKKINEMAFAIKDFATKLDNGDFDKYAESIMNMGKLIFTLTTGLIVGKIALGGWNKGLVAYNALTKTSVTWTGKFHKALGLLGAAFVGWEVGTYLRNEFEVVEKAGIALASGLHISFRRIKGAASEMGLGLKFALGNPIDFIRERFANLFKAISFLPKSVLRGLGFDKLADGLVDIGDKISPETADKLKKDINDVRATTESDVTGIKDIYSDMFTLVGSESDALNKKLTELGKAPDKAPDQNLTEAEKKLELLKYEISLIKQGVLAKEAAYQAELKFGQEGSEDLTRLTRELEINKELQKIKLETAAATKELELVRSGVNPEEASIVSKREAGLLDADAAKAALMILDLEEKRAIVLKELADQKAQVENPFKELANFDFSSVFGDIGNPFSEALKGASDMVDSLNENKKQLKDLEKSNMSTADKDKKRVKIALSGSADMLGAAKGFFKEKSKGYEVLGKAEKVLGAIELAMSAQRLATTLATNAGIIASNIAATATYVTNAIAGAFVGVGPTGLVTGALMIAALAAVGLSSKGGGSSKGPSLQETQAAQSTGGVLGDSKAKSESAFKAFDVMADNLSDLQKINTGMLFELQNLNNNLNGLGDILLRKGDFGINAQTGSSLGGAGGLAKTALDLSTLGLTDEFDKLLGGSLGNIASGISSKSVKQVNGGVRILGAEVSDILNEGVVESFSWATIRTKKRKFGSGTKTRFSEITKSLGGEIDNQFGEIIQNIFSSVGSAVELLGIGDMSKAVFEGLSVSTMGMSQEDTIKEIQAALSNLADNVASDVLPILKEFQRGGEALYETLARVATQTVIFKDVADSLGGVLGAALNPEEMVRVADALSDAAGGLDKFAANAQSYMDFALTEEQKFNKLQAGLTKVFNDLGEELPKTRQGVINFVNSLNLATKSGRSAYTSITAAADLMDEFFSELEDNFENALSAAKDAVNEAESALRGAYDTEAGRLNRLIDLLNGVTTTLSSFYQTLIGGKPALLSPEAQYNADKAALQSTSTKALSGDLEALQQLKSVSDAFLESSKSYNASGSAYFDDLDRVKQIIQQAIGVTSTEQSKVEFELVDLDDVVGKLIDINSSVLTVATAVQNLNIARAEQTAVIAANDKAIADAKAANDKAIADRLAKEAGGARPPVAPAPPVVVSGLSEFDRISAENAALVAEWNNFANNNSFIGGLNFFGFAKGGAFSKGQSTKFAKGGSFTNSIVDRPTNFNMGLMGEAGPEAIMPLSKGSDGTLGVRLMGGGFDTTPIVAEIQSSNKNLQALVRLQQASNQRILEKLDSIDDRLETVETKTRLQASA